MLRRLLAALFLSALLSSVSSTVSTPILNSKTARATFSPLSNNLFRAVTWDMTLAEVKQKEGAFPHQENFLGVIYKESRIPALANIGRIAYFFHRGNLAVASYGLKREKNALENKQGEQEDFYTMLNALTGYYGKPKEEPYFTNKDLHQYFSWFPIGKGVDGYYAEWENEQSYIALRLYNNKSRLYLVLQMASKVAIERKKNSRPNSFKNIF